MGEVEGELKMGAVGVWESGIGSTGVADGASFSIDALGKAL